MFIAVITFTYNYPHIKSAVNEKYAFTHGNISSVALNHFSSFDQSGVFFTYDEATGYQGSILEEGSLKPLETRHISGSITFLGEEFPISFFCCEKDNSLAIMYAPGDIYHMNLSSIKGSTDKVLVTLYCKYEYNGSFSMYPLILDINTMETQDFLAGCRVLDQNKITYISVNDTLTEAVVMNNHGELYYCSPTSSSMTKICELKSNRIGSLKFCDGETIIYSTFSSDGLRNNYYEYSISSRTISPCLQYSHSSVTDQIYPGVDTAIITKGINEYYAVDIRSQSSTSIPAIPQKQASLLTATNSPNGKLFMFIYTGYASGSYSYPDNIKLKSLYLYNVETNKITDLKLSNYKDVLFKSPFWYDNSHIGFIVQKAESSKSSNQTTDTGTDKLPGNETTLWLFDTNKLK